MLKTITGGTPSELPLYSMMLILGALTAFIMLNIFMHKGGFSKFVKKRVRRSLGLSAIFSTILSIMANWLFHTNLLTLSLYNRFANGGICFAVWLISFFSLSALFLRIYKLDIKKCLDITVPPLLMATFIARVGCSLGGCCYGMDTLFGYHLPIPFPIREIEALFVLVLAIVLCAAFKGKRLTIYSIAYPTFRFFAEFLRGDDRGSFFGLPFFSPTQVLSAITVLVAIIVIVIGAVKRSKARKLAKNAENSTSTEPTAENGAAQPEADTEKALEAPVVKKQSKPKYEPRPVDYTDPKKRANPFLVILKILLGILLAIGIAVFAFFAYNPFGLQWVSNINYYTKDALGFIFDEGGYTYDLSDSVSLSVLDVSDKSPIHEPGDALALVNGLDSEIFHSYALSGSQSLSNGNTAYHFTQILGDTPVYGKTACLVVDSNHAPLFVLKDVANETFSTNIASDYELPEKGFGYYFDESYTTISNTLCYYDTGEGLILANQLIVADENQNQYSVLCESQSLAVIKITDAHESSPLEARANQIVEGAEKVVSILNGDQAEIKRLRKQKFKKLDLQNTAAAIESALCNAYLKSGFSAEEFTIAVKTATEISATKPDLSEQLFCDVLAQTVEQTAIQKGCSEKKAKKLCDSVYSSFKSCGIKKATDEKPVQINVKEKNTVVKNTIGSADDADMIRVSMQENHVMRFDVSSDIGIDIQVCTADGKSLLTTYTSSDLEFALYPEDGTDYVIKITASEAQSALWSEEEDYKVSVKADPRKDEMPSFINTVLYEMSASFASSKGYMFGLLFYGDTALTGEEFSTLSALPAIENCSNSCSSSCTGQQLPPTDMVKQYILEKLAVDPGDFDSISISPETVMEISCFRYIETENGALVKAKIKVSNGEESCEGYSFFRLEHFEEINTFDPIVDLADTIGIDRESAQTVATILNEAFSYKYYVTELNTSALLSAFGDSFGNISDEDGMPSLYDFWEKDTQYSYLKAFNQQAALNAGYSKATVQEFEKYTVKHNIAYCDRVYENLKMVHSSLNLHASGLKTGYDLYSFVDDPFGYVLGEATDNIVVHSVYRIGKIAWGVATGDITDIAEAVAGEAIGDFVEEGINTYAGQIQKDAKVIEQQAEKVKAVRETYVRRLSEFDSGYFWEIFF